MHCQKFTYIVYRVVINWYGNEELFLYGHEELFLFENVVKGINLVELFIETLTAENGFGSNICGKMLF